MIPLSGKLDSPVKKRDLKRCLGAVRLGELAELVGGEVAGDPELAVAGVRSLERAGPGDPSFVTRAAFREQALRSRAGALLVPPALAAPLAGAAAGGAGEAADDALRSRPLLIAEHPTLALARIIERFHPAASPAPGVHRTAVVSEGCEIDPSAQVSAYAVIGEGTRVAAGVSIGPHAVIGRGCRVGTGSVLHAHVVLYDATEIGERVVVHAGTVLGADGFGYASHAGEHVKVPQVGRTVVESDVEIGALSAIDRALLEETRIGAGSKIDNLVQVGHNVQIGRGCLLCGQAGVAGSARLGDYVVMGGQSGAADHVNIARGVQAAGKSAILQSVPEAGLQVGGIPAIDLKRWRRQLVRLEHMDRLARRVRVLEKKLAASEAGAPEARKRNKV